VRKYLRQFEITATRSGEEMRMLKVLVSLSLVTLYTLSSFTATTTTASTNVQPLSSGPYPLSWNATPIPFSPGPFLTVGPDIRVTNSIADQNEVSIAINPVNPPNLLIGANDGRGPENDGKASWCGAYASFDGGLHWTTGLLPHMGALAWDTWAADPSVAFDLQGNAYFACLGYVPRSSPPWIMNNTIAVAKSVDGGRTFLPPVSVVSVAASPPFHDKPYIAVDVSPTSPYKNNVYISWTNFSTFGGPSPIYFSRSVDGGMSFSTPVKISGSLLNNQGSQPSVGPNGEVYVSFLNYRPSLPNKLYIAVSLDGGVTFQAPSFVTDVYNPESPFDGRLPPGSYRVPTLPSIAVDISNGPYRGSVYVVWQDKRLGNADIFIAYSRDGGVSWSIPVKVNNDATINHQFFPFVSVAPTGRVDVVFYDRRNDPNNFLFDVFAAISFNGGASFWNRRITDRLINPGPTNFIGDYIGVTSLNNLLFPAWCDLRDGNEEIYMERTPVIRLSL